MFRSRFQANAEDYRPVKFPPPHPFWCTGYAGDESYSIIVAYVDSEDQLLEYWPEAENIDLSEADEYFFSDRFPKPEWLDNPDITPKTTIDVAVELLRRWRKLYTDLGVPDHGDGRLFSETGVFCRANDPAPDKQESK